jgi:hydroxymethylpyrimidine kinase/phosphomethylpyrimidine kinase
VEGVDPKLITETLQALVSDIRVEAVHIGMLGNERVVEAVADYLGHALQGKDRLPHVVLDPILKSSSGADLLDAAGIRVLIEKLLPLAEVVTPNLDEASVLAGIPVSNLDQMRAAAARLHSLGAANVVVTGGHLDQDKAVDLLSFTSGRGLETEIFKASRQRSNSTHGTGCAFATAVACHLAHARGLPEAVLLAKAYVSAAIANAYPLGQGVGPVNHLYRFSQPRRASSVIAEVESAHARN